MNAKDAKFAVCRHIKTNGRRCQSPALRGGALCFYHRKLHVTHRRPANPQALTSNWQEADLQADLVRGENDPFDVARARVYPKQDEIQFPPLEDAESVQLATSILFQAVATGQIHFQRARILLYTLKIASINLRALARARAEEADASAIPTHTVRTTQGHALAAPDPDPDSVADSDAQPIAPAAPPPPPTGLTDSSQLIADSCTRNQPPLPSEPTASVAATAPTAPAPTSAVATKQAPTALPIPAWGKRDPRPGQGAPCWAEEKEQRAEGPTYSHKESTPTLIQ